MTDAAEKLVIDGSHGEGGGQILRSALSLAALTGRALRIERIRARRRKPGLAAQHLTAVRAAARIADAGLAGDTLGSERLDFRPGAPARAGIYHFDVAAAREGGSAGAAALVLQTVAMPLALAPGASRVTVVGGTHVPWSPAFDYLERVWLETLRRLGLAGDAALAAWGFYPVGQGRIVLHLGGRNPEGIAALSADEREPLAAIDGRAVAANLPSHIAQRMADRARALLTPLGVPVAIATERVRAASPGAWIFLRAAYGGIVAGFGAHGRRGKPAEEVAEEATAELLAHHGRGPALDRHLADQMLLPLAFARGPSAFSCEAVTSHLETNAWVIEQFGVAAVEIEQNRDGTGRVRVEPRPWSHPGSGATIGAARGATRQVTASTEEAHMASSHSNALTASFEGLRDIQHDMTFVIHDSEPLKPGTRIVADHAEAAGSYLEIVGETGQGVWEAEWRDQTGRSPHAGKLFRLILAPPIEYEDDLPVRRCFRVELIGDHELESPWSK